MAETRETQVLEDVVESTEIENPRTTEEAILAKIIAGEEVDINARTRYQAYLKELSSISGGNPNYVETVTGTLANPWGEKTPSDLFSGAKSGNLTMIINVDATAIGGTRLSAAFYPFGNINVFRLTIANSQLSNWLCVYAEYYDSGVINAAYGLQNEAVLDYSLYASLISTTLTIIYHPLPEDNT